MVDVVVSPQAKRDYVIFAGVALLATTVGHMTMGLIQGNIGMTYIPMQVGPIATPLEFFSHNVSIGLASWISGIGVFGPFFIIWQNGINFAHYFTCAFGTGTAVCSGASSLSETTFMIAFLIPHGIFEIPAILISIGMGFFLAHVTFTKYITRTNHEVSLVGAVKSTLPWMGGAVVLFVIAAFIESNLSVGFAQWAAGTV